jgi:hypothetical protein
VAVSARRSSENGSLRVKREKEDPMGFHFCFLRWRRRREKVKFALKLMAKNPFMPTARIWVEIFKKFGRGLPEKTINRVRAKRFGVKIGPRGVILDAATGGPRRFYLSDLSGLLRC